MSRIIEGKTKDLQPSTRVRGGPITVDVLRDHISHEHRLTPEQREKVHTVLTQGYKNLLELMTKGGFLTFNGTLATGMSLQDIKGLAASRVLSVKAADLEQCLGREAYSIVPRANRVKDVLVFDWNAIASLAYIQDARFPMLGPNYRLAYSQDSQGFYQPLYRLADNAQNHMRNLFGLDVPTVVPATVHTNAILWDCITRQGGGIVLANRVSHPYTRLHVYKPVK